MTNLEILKDINLAFYEYLGQLYFFSMIHK